MLGGTGSGSLYEGVPSLFAFQFVGINIYTPYCVLSCFPSSSSSCLSLLATPLGIPQDKSPKIFYPKINLDRTIVLLYIKRMSLEPCKLLDYREKLGQPIVGTLLGSTATPSPRHKDFKKEMKLAKTKGLLNALLELQCLWPEVGPRLHHEFDTVGEALAFFRGYVYVNDKDGYSERQRNGLT